MFKNSSGNRSSGVVAMLLTCALSSHAMAQVEAGTSGADALLAKGSFQPALEAYQSVLQGDPKHVAALVGSAHAYAGLNQMPRAVAALEKALTIAPHDRVVVHNLALVLFKTDNQPRGFKVLRDYLQANRNPDEPMLNELLYMLGAASDVTRKTKPYQDAQTTADQYTKTLEAQVPGFRRWGAVWLEAHVVEQRVADNKLLQKDLERLDARIKEDTENIVAAEKQMAVIRDRVAKGWDHEYKLERHVDMLRRLKDDRQLKLEDREKVLARMNKPAEVAEPSFIKFGTAAPPISKPEPPPPPPPPPVANPEGNPDGSGRPTKRPPRQPVRPQEPPPGEQEPVMPPPPVTPKAAEPKKVSHHGVAFAISQDTLIVSADLVKDATEIVLQSPSGANDDGTVLRSDPAVGLALVKLKKLKAASLPLAPNFAGGAVQCVALPTIDLFRIDTQLIDGTAPAPGEKWTVALSKHPKLIGAPLVSGGKVVGVTLGHRDSEAGAIPAVTIEQLTKFIGADFGTRGTPAADPKQAIFQIVVTKIEAQ